MKRTAMALCGCLAAVGVACGPTVSGEEGLDAGGHDAISSHIRDDGPQADALPDGPPPQSDAGPPPPTIFYAHTDTTLFKADATVHPITLTELGDFECVGGVGQDESMTDVAVDREGRLFGVSASAVYPLTVSGSSVLCMGEWTLPSEARFYGLTFAPAGVLSADEMLVAANSAGELWAIDSLGHVTQVGTFGTVPADDGHGHVYDYVGEPWELSGDIVFLHNGGAWLGFATVRDCPNPPYSTNCNNIDTLIEINVSLLALGNTSSVTKSVRGQVVKGAGCTDSANPDGYGSMYGIVAHEALVYGFSRAGHLVEISNVDGTACLVATYDGEKFAGAGVSTLVPVIGPD